MDFHSIVQISLSVLKNPIVIICAVGVILYLAFMGLIANYKKKPPRPKKGKKIAAPAPKPKKEESAETEEAK
mgnify:CR=1 FL=1